VETGVRNGTALLDCYTVKKDLMMKCLLPSQEKMEAKIKIDHEQQAQ
jgi:hypothetical protein